MKKSSDKRPVPPHANSPAEAGGLDAYRKKRDPARTVEPFVAERAPSVPETRRGQFVVHLHDATRRHYDLRLQIGGALKSFAVPKGPTLDPREKRLAVNTEDHPLEYLDFEDVIPEGNYGAGPMIVWDTGRVTYLDGTAEEGHAAGKIDFVLAGYKLKGRFALVRTGNRRGRDPKEANQWLLIKKEDAYSSEERDIVAEEPLSVLSGLAVEELGNAATLGAEVTEAAAATGAPEGAIDFAELTPMLCALSGATLDDPSRYYELKLDGVRILAERKGEGVSLRYRSHKSATQAYPEIVRALRALPLPHFVVDGEIIAMDETGRPSFQRLGRRIAASRPHDVALAAREVPVMFVVFDVLAVGSRDLRGLPLWQRKELLDRIVPNKGVVRRLDVVEGRGSALFELCRRQHLEGVVAKRKDAPYRPGPRRYDDWVKIKCEREADFVVVGWVEEKERRALGSLELATWDGARFVRRGRVGSGLDTSTRKRLQEILAALSSETPTAEGPEHRSTRGRHHVRPALVVSVEFLGFSEDGSLRHPAFRGLREDVEPRSCTEAPPSELLARAPEPVSPVEPRAHTAPSGRVVVTNRDKIFWPDEGYTKGDLLDYYAAVSDVMLPHLRERPIVLVRYPDGITGKSFYQWNAPEGTPDWLETHRFRDDDGKEGKQTFIVGDVDGLVHIANLGCIPIHILACRRSTEESCDFLTVDFDIGERPFRDAVVLALSLRDLLAELGLSGYPKTSGQSGLHVLIPLGPGIPFATAKMLVELVGRVIQMRHPDMATMERRVSERGGRVYVDTGQTGRSRTIVAPYSVRAHAGATVSVPLTWDEVHLALDPTRFTMFTVPDRIAEVGDPMADLLAERPDVPSAVERLGAKLGAVG